MISTIESVTLGVTRLEPAVHLLRDQLGLKVIKDTRASVGLLSAWKVPVHESVRLVELANGSSASGRIRLAVYEDDARDQGAGAKSNPPLTIGPKGIDFDGGSLALAAAAEGLPVWFPANRQPNATPDGTASALWVITADITASTQFYCEIFGFTATEERAIKDPGHSLYCLLGMPASGNLHLISLRPTLESNTKVVLVHLPGADYRSSDHPMRPGWPGFNLISLHCDEFDTLVERFEELGIEPVTSPTHVGLPTGRPGRVMLVRGPNQELFEFTEDAA